MAKVVEPHPGQPSASQVRLQLLRQPRSIDGVAALSDDRVGEDASPA